MEAIILDFINNVMDKNIILVYASFFISCMLQLVFPPFPSDVVLIFQGYITSFGGSFQFIPILLNAITGTFLGSLIVYKFGYYKGDAVFKYKIVNRFIDVKHRNRAERLLNKYGSYAIVMAKFVPGVSAILLLFAGMFKIKARVVYISILCSILVHHILVLLLGRFLGSNIENVKSILKTYNIIIVSLIVLVILIFAINHSIKKKKSKT